MSCFFWRQMGRGTGWLAVEDGNRREGEIGEEDGQQLKKGRRTDHMEVFLEGRDPGENEKESLRKKKRKV